jgi:hypothetical protein
VSDKTPSLSDIDKIAEFLHTAGKAGSVASLTEAQSAHLRDAIAALADLDPYFIEAANFKPAELLMIFQRVAAASGAIRQIEEKVEKKAQDWYGDLRNDRYAEAELLKMQHKDASDALRQLASGIVERARMERGPKP